MDKLYPEAVIFDLGSTLIEYEAVPWSELNVLCAARMRDYLKEEGFQVPDEQEFYRTFEEVKDRYRRIALESLAEWTVPQAAAELLTHWHIEANGDLLDRLFDAFYEPITEKIYVYDDVLQTLQRTRRCHSTIGLISNTIFPERAHRKELKRFGIEPFLDFAVFSSTFGIRKPHPDIFFKAANLAGYAPAECVYIGDRYVEDVEGPVGVGMAAILKLWAGREYPDDMPRASRKIRTLSELDEHLELDC